jgi:hypothetical protein
MPFLDSQMTPSQIWHRADGNPSVALSAIATAVINFPISTTDDIRTVRHYNPE